MIGAEGGIKGITNDPHLSAGVNVHRGDVTNSAVAASLGLSHTEIGSAIIH